MRILETLALMIFLGAGVASAVTVNLNDGRSVQGDIIKQDNKSLQINVDGVTMTYYADEIKDVDGNPLSALPAPVAVAPAAPVETAVSSETPEATTPQAEPALLPEAAAPATPGADGIDPEKKALILKFIDVFGTRQALISNFQLMINQIQKEKPDEAQKIRDRVKVDEIIERLLPIYDRNFSSDDLRAFIVFYGSEAGQKLISTIPQLMKESVGESEKYMEEKFPEAKQG